MRIKVSIISAILILLLTAVFTNPNKEQYIYWSKEQIIQKSDGLAGVLASMMAPTIIDGTTKVSNYYLFSLYKTKIADEEVTVLGAFRNFVAIGKGKEQVKANVSP